MNNRINIAFAAAVLFCGCGNSENDSTATRFAPSELQNTDKQLPMNEFLSWVADTDNELAKTKELSEIQYKICYLPKQTMAYMELKNEAYTDAQFREACGHYSEMSYFNFRLELNGGSGELLKYKLSSAAEYNDRVTYMSFRMQNDIFLVQGKDTLHPGLFHFERIYEVAPYATVMLAFDDKKFSKDNEFTIVYDDKLFHKGYIKYNYRPKQLIDLPNLAGV